MDVYSMSDAALLAILVGRERAAQLAKKPLAEVFGYSKPRQLTLCEPVLAYEVHPELSAAKELLTRCMHAQMAEEAIAISSPNVVRSFLCSNLGHLDYEVFWVLWLDAQNRLIAAEELFRGTATQTSVYPREVVKSALSHGAICCMVAHNHPSGCLEPSHNDRYLTDQLKTTIAMVEVKLLDHVIVSGSRSISFAERGWI